MPLRPLSLPLPQRLFLPSKDSKVSSLLFCPISGSIFTFATIQLGSRLCTLTRDCKRSKVNAFRFACCPFGPFPQGSLFNGPELKVGQVTYVFGMGNSFESLQHLRDDQTGLNILSYWSVFFFVKTLSTSKIIRWIG